jgi:hypothetical protein
VNKAEDCETILRIQLTAGKYEIKFFFSLFLLLIKEKNSHCNKNTFPNIQNEQSPLANDCWKLSSTVIFRVWLCTARRYNSSDSKTKKERNGKNLTFMIACILVAYCNNPPLHHYA